MERNVLFLVVSTATILSVPASGQPRQATAAPSDSAKTQPAPDRRPPDNPDWAALWKKHSALARQLQELLRFAQSDEESKAALKIAEDHFGADCFGATRNLTILAKNALAEGYPERAEPLAREALTRRERLLGPHSFWLAETYSLLFEIEFRRENFHSAKTFALREMAVVDENVRPDDIRRSEPLDCLGRAEYMLGDAERALPLLEQAVSLLEKQDRRDSLRLVKPLTHLGRCYGLLNERAKAKACFARALSICDRHYPSDNVDHLNPLLAQANDEMIWCEYAEAIPLLERAHKIAKTWPRQGHPSRLNIRRAYARCLRACGRAKEAAEIDAPVPLIDWHPAPK